MPAGFNISTFRANIQENGLQKTNKFLCRIPMPAGMQGNENAAALVNTARNLEFWGVMTDIPMFGVTTIPYLRYGYGALEKKPLQPIFTEHIFNFMLDSKGAIFSFFYEWNRLIINNNLEKGITTIGGQTNGTPMDPYELSYKYEYAVNATIIVYDDAGKESINITLREAFPILVPGVQLAWQDQNKVAYLPVTVSYFDWYPNPLNRE